jgi:hypothetical protein
VINAWLTRFDIALITILWTWDLALTFFVIDDLMPVPRWDTTINLRIDRISLDEATRR